MIVPAFNRENSTPIRELFDAQRRQAVFLKESSAEERIAKLKKIQAYLLANRAVLAKALYADFRKPAAISAGRSNGFGGRCYVGSKLIGITLRPHFLYGQNGSGKSGDDSSGSKSDVGHARIGR